MDDEASVQMTPSQYEAWLQIYKTPKTALKQYARYKELDQKRENGTLHGAEVKECEKLRNSFSDLLTRWMFQLFRNYQDPKMYPMMVEAVTAPSGKVMKETNKIISYVLKHDDQRN